MSEDGGYQMPVNPYALEHGLLQFQVDNEEIIDTIKHTVMEEMPSVDNLGRLSWVRYSDISPMVNDKGMNAILSRLRGRMTKVFALSDFEEDVIEQMTIALSDETIRDLRDNWELYEVRSPSAASMIVSIVVENYFAILRKAKSGLYLKFLKTSQIVQESNIFRDEQRQRQQPDFEESRKTLPIFGGMFAKRRGR